VSRSGYNEDCDGWDLIRWRGAVNSAIKGKRGQQLLTEMATALDAMPVKKLISDELISKDGEVCALGAVAKYKSLPVDNIDPHDSAQVAGTFNIAEALAREIAFINDDAYCVTPEYRWKVVRQWVNENIQQSEEAERD
jgi:hypothetical protein